MIAARNPWFGSKQCEDRDTPHHHPLPPHSPPPPRHAPPPLDLQCLPLPPPSESSATSLATPAATPKSSREFVLKQNISFVCLCLFLCFILKKSKKKKARARAQARAHLMCLTDFFWPALKTSMQVSGVGVASCNYLTDHSESTTMNHRF